MPANTPTGYPYPLPTEPVAEGAQAIRNLAEALKGLKCIAELDLAAATVFSAIPTTFDHLRLVIQARTPQSTKVVANFLRFNGDTGNNYDHSYIQVNNNAVAGGQAVQQPQMHIGAIPGSTVYANYYGHADLMLPNAIGAVIGVTHAFCPVSPSAGGVIDHYSGTNCGTWRGLARVTQIDLFPAGGGLYEAGSRAWLYGVIGA